MPKILIDAGHGGAESGAVSQGIMEKNLTLEVAKYLKKELVSNGFSVVMTRESDVAMGLSPRGSMAITNNCDALVCIHFNALDGTAHGTEVFASVVDPHGVSRTLATNVLNETVARFGTTSRGVKERRGTNSPNRNYYSVMMAAEPIPNILVEGLFIDNAGDAAIAKKANFASNLAKAYAKGIAKTFRVPYKETTNASGVFPVNMKNTNNTSWVDKSTVKPKTPYQSTPKATPSTAQKVADTYSSSPFKDRSIDGSSGFAIFFDNVRIDQYVKNFSTNLFCDGAIGTASIETIYIPDFYRIETFDKAGSVLSSEAGVENMTNVKIFIKNMFNNKYVLAFDGNIRGKQLTKTSGGYSMSFSAVDYMQWLNRALVPLAISLDDRTIANSTFQWYAQGIDVANTANVVSQKDLIFSNTTLTQFILKLMVSVLGLNVLFSSKDGVAYWDGALDRIQIMGDIDKRLIDQKIVDFKITSQVTSVNSLYVLLNDILKNLMMEFYQDRDGAIRIKPPFWNEKVLYDHVIDPIAVISFNENVDYSNYVTRVITIGGIEEYFENSDARTRQQFLPVGVLLGSAKGHHWWEDYTSYKRKGSKAEREIAAKTATPPKANVWFTKYPTALAYGSKITVFDPETGAPIEDPSFAGTEYSINVGTEVRHVGFTGIARVQQQTNAKGALAGYGNYVAVEIIDGDFSGSSVIYAYLSKIDVQDGAIVKDGSLLGRVGTNSKYVGTLRVDVRMVDGTTVDAVTYAAAAAKDNSYVPPAALANSNEFSKGDVLLEPTLEEKKYGANITSVSQPIIKFSKYKTLEKKQAGRNALNLYGQYMYNYMNASTQTANLQTVAMPWIRPGFNIWVDPVALDRVYYVNSVSHHGGPDGVYTSLGLTMGRSRVGFTKGGDNVFGSMSAANSNIFISSVSKHVSDFGATLDSNSDFESIRKRMISYYNSEDGSISKADNTPHLQALYGKIDYDKPIIAGEFPGRLDPFEFNKDYTVAEIQSKLNNRYSKAPEIVRNRANKMKKIMASAKAYANAHYISESNY